MLNYTGTLTEKVNMLQNRFQGYVNRLQIVRENRQRKLDDEGLYHSRYDEIFSETSSISSGHSSKKTSSSRRYVLKLSKSRK